MGQSQTTLYSEASGRDRQCFTGGKWSQSYAAGLDATGMIWADSDNRITVTGYRPDRHATNFQDDRTLCDELRLKICKAMSTPSTRTARTSRFAERVPSRSVNATINIATLAALVTKGGGEVIPPDGY